VAYLLAVVVTITAIAIAIIERTNIIVQIVPYYSSSSYYILYVIMLEFGLYADVRKKMR
jgi:hypothetical protein